MYRFLNLLLVFLTPLLAEEQSKLVAPDIGRSTNDSGAVSPDGKLSECAFWYRHVGEIKQEIESAGYRCNVCNRGNAPTQEPLTAYAKNAGALHRHKPYKGGVRYPSTYYPARMVFLHLNSAGSTWQKNRPCGAGHPQPNAWVLSTG